MSIYLHDCPETPMSRRVFFDFSFFFKNLRFFSIFAGSAEKKRRSDDVGAVVVVVFHLNL